MDILERAVFNIVSESEKPVKRCDLAKKIGVPERKIQQIIGSLNHKGIAIVSRGNGFFLAKTDIDIREGTEKLHKAAITLLHRVSAIRKITVAEYTDQLKLEFQRDDG